jgi:enoyl-CoA hydratase/carnithine racemase
MLAEIEICINEKVNPFTNNIRVLIISAVGKHFTSGIDLKSAASIGGLSQNENEEEEDFSRKSI